MADTTIVNTPASSDSGAAGWIVALIVLIAVIVGGFFLYRSYAHATHATPAPAGNTNINVTVPTPAPTVGGTSGGTTY